MTDHESAAAGSGPPLRPCEHTRCKRQVFDAKIVKKSGVADVVLDAVPKTWEEGARFKLVPSWHVPHQLVEKLTATQIHRAFAVRHLYVEHAEVCETEQRKRKVSKKTGHA
jgi:hypothetical protein